MSYSWLYVSLVFSRLCSHWLSFHYIPYHTIRLKLCEFYEMYVSAMPITILSFFFSHSRALYIYIYSIRLSTLPPRYMFFSSFFFWENIYIFSVVQMTRTTIACSHLNFGVYHSIYPFCTFSKWWKRAHPALTYREPNKRIKLYFVCSLPDILAFMAFIGQSPISHYSWTAPTFLIRQPLYNLYSTSNGYHLEWLFQTLSIFHRT